MCRASTAAQAAGQPYGKALVFDCAPGYGSAQGYVRFRCEESGGFESADAPCAESSSNNTAAPTTPAATGVYTLSGVTVFEGARSERRRVLAGEPA